MSQIEVTAYLRSNHNINILNSILRRTREFDIENQ